MLTSIASDILIQSEGSEVTEADSDVSKLPEAYVCGRVKGHHACVTNCELLIQLFYTKESSF